MTFGFAFLYLEDDFYERLKNKALQHQTGVVEEFVHIDDKDIEKKTTGNIIGTQDVIQPIYFNQEMLNNQHICLDIFMSTCDYDNEDDLYIEVLQKDISQVYKVDMKDIDNFQYMNFIIDTDMFSVGEAEVRMYCEPIAKDHKIVAYLTESDQLEGAIIGGVQSQYSLAMHIYNPVTYLLDDFEYVYTKIVDSNYKESGITPLITSEKEMDFDISLSKELMSAEQDIYIWFKAGTFEHECKGNLIICIEQDGDVQRESISMSELVNNQYFKLKLDKKSSAEGKLNITITSDNEDTDSTVCLYTMEDDNGVEIPQYYITLE